MIIYPAIDLRGGKVVRLKEGDPNRQTTFSDDPLAIAQNWIAQGAAWIHMVNLDGAFSDANGAGVNRAALEKVIQTGIKVQFGGGLRSMEDISLAISQGASRVVLGTIAVQQPEIVAEAVERFGAEAICVALDAKNGKIATHGWQQTADLTPTALGQAMREHGVKHALYTDISRDGNLSGVNVEATIALGRTTGLNVIASGGVSTLDEIRQLAQSQAVAGAVIGMALYEGRLPLAEALKAVGGQ